MATASKEYDMVIEYRPGEKMQHVDALSRHPVDVNIITMIKEDWLLTVHSYTIGCNQRSLKCKMGTVACYDGW